jgi:beta-glucosidase
VTNTGKVAGKEVVQVYVHDKMSALARPPKELKAFAKVELQPGETRTVTLALDFRAFAYYHPAYRQWITEDGEFDILIGASSADIRCTRTVTLQSTLELPSLLNRESTLGDWMEDPRGKRVFGPLFQQMTARMQAAFGGGEGEAIGMDTMGFLMQMPLLGMLHFQEGALPAPPEEMVDGLLAQVHGAEK